MPEALLYTLTADEHKRDLFARQAAEDWQKFLLHRCKELAPGKYDDITHSPAVV